MAINEQATIDGLLNSVIASGMNDVITHRKLILIIMLLDAIRLIIDNDMVVMQSKGGSQPSGSNDNVDQDVIRI